MAPFKKIQHLNGLGFVTIFVRFLGSLLGIDDTVDELLTNFLGSCFKL